MISHMESRKSLKKAVLTLDPNKTKINWPMAKIRHAVFEIIDKCPQLSRTSWQLNTALELTTCRLFFNKQIIELTYDYKKKSMKVKDVFVNWEVDIDPARTVETVCSRMPKKKVVVIKKKVEK